MELNYDQIASFDSEGMLDLIQGFPEQLQDALNLSKKQRLKVGAEIRNVCLAGMGGSAIGGDIVKGFAGRQLRVPFIVNRNYTLPHFVNRHTLVFLSSYSGNTEETLSAYRDAVERGAQIVCITSGGKLEELARTNGHHTIRIPAGYPPRAALGYLAVPVLCSLYDVGLIGNPETDILDAIDVVGDLRQKNAPDLDINPSKRFAHALFNKIPVIYASVDVFEPVALRWKGQLSENSEVMAFCNTFPEMNHNEIMGWGPLEEVNTLFHVIFLRDRLDHKRIQKRMELCRPIISKYAGPLTEIESTGDSLLARIFSLIYLGDMTSLYLSTLYGVNPTSIDNIDTLKNGLL
jgi:glucose/mannose-6-phosphate isomerase